MEVTLPLEKMSTEDKIRTMEIIWADLCKNAESLSSPSRHKNILDEREKAIETGKEVFIDWSKAKKQIEDETRHGACTCGS
ncbi:MAG: addiction module protein [Candidatus Anammoxibacter sp.]